MQLYSYNLECMEGSKEKEMRERLVIQGVVPVISVTTPVEAPAGSRSDKVEFVPPMYAP